MAHRKIMASSVSICSNMPVSNFEIELYGHSGPYWSSIKVTGYVLKYNLGLGNNLDMRIGLIKQAMLDHVK